MRPDGPGVHKTTLYRRWGTKPRLVAAAVRDRSQQRIPVPDTGTLAGDLAALGRAVLANLQSDVGGPAAKTLVVAAATSPEVAREAPAFWAERIHHTGTIIDRAKARGEVPADTNANLVIETLIGPLWVRFLLTGDPLDNSVVDHVAKLLTTGLTSAPTGRHEA